MEYEGSIGFVMTKMNFLLAAYIFFRLSRAVAVAVERKICAMPTA
jgi:hypothetical protein